MSAVDAFIDELRGDPHLADRADLWAHLLAEIDFCANVIPDACALYDGCLWIISQQRTTEEKVNMMVRLNCEGKSTNVTMQKFTGWVA